MEISKPEEFKTEMSNPIIDLPEEVASEKSSAPLSQGLVIGLVIAIIALAGVAGFYAGKSARSSAQPTPTPTPTTIVTPSITVAPSPTDTVIPTPTPTATASATPTPTPTTAWVTKKANIKEFGGDYTLKFTLILPSDVTVTEQKIGPWNGILLKRGTKSFMAFNLPYELYEQQGYSSLTNVVSTKISSLKRARAKKVFDNSGTYKFAVAYVTSTHSGKDCTEAVIGNVTTSPCVAPILSYNAEIAFSAYCSIDPTYLAICDQVMKTIVVTK